MLPGAISSVSTSMLGLTVRSFWCVKMTSASRSESPSAPPPASAAGPASAVSSAAAAGVAKGGPSSGAACLARRLRQGRLPCCGPAQPGGRRTQQRPALVGVRQDDGLAGRLCARPAQVPAAERRAADEVDVLKHGQVLPPGACTARQLSQCQRGECPSLLQGAPMGAIVELTSGRCDVEDGHRQQRPMQVPAPEGCHRHKQRVWRGCTSEDEQVARQPALHTVYLQLVPLHPLPPLPVCGDKCTAGGRSAAGC
jgi:hypothetical protein